MNEVRCYWCNSEMIWGADFSFDDYEYEGEGVVAVLSCTNEDCGSSAEFKSKSEE